MPEKALTILAVDDDPADAEILRRHLQAMPGPGVDFVHVLNEEAVLPQLARRPADLIVLDYHLGPVLGLDVLKNVRACGFQGPVRTPAKPR